MCETRLIGTFFENIGYIKYLFLCHGCSNNLSLEMEAEFVKKNLSYLNLNISRTKNFRNNL